MPDTSLVLVKPADDTEVMAFYEQAIGLRDYAKARVITTNEDLKPANDDLNVIAIVKKGMEARRKDYLKPFQDHVSSVNDAYKVLMLPILEADKINSAKVLAFNAEQRRKIQEAEAIEAEKIALAKREEELTGEHTIDLAPVDKPDAVPDRIRTDMGTTGERVNWKYEVFDFALLPDEYKVADTAMLNSIAKKYKDLKQVPGVRFYNEPILAKYPVNTRRGGD